MSTMKRLAALAVMTAFALAFAATALASYTPKLVVSQAADKTTIHVTIPKADDSTAALVIYAPAGLAATLNQAPGTPIGTVTASVNAKAISPDAILPLTGTTVVANQADPAIMAAATACTHTTTHAATWALVLTAAGQTLNVPAFVDPTSGAEAALGSTRIQVCLPSPDVPVAQGGATFGAKLLDVNFTVQGIFATSTAPLSAWLATFIPYVAGTATVNPAGHVSVAGIQAMASIAFAAKAAKGHRAAFSGKVTAGGVPAPGQPIGIYWGSKKVASATTGATGGFSAVAKLKKGTYTFRAKLTAADTDVTAQACALVPAAAIPAIGPCVSATAAGGIAFSSSVRLKVK